MSRYNVYIQSNKNWNVQMTHFKTIYATLLLFLIATLPVKADEKKFAILEHGINKIVFCKPNWFTKTGINQYGCLSEKTMNLDAFIGRTGIVLNPTPVTHKQYYYYYSISISDYTPPKGYTMWLESFATEEPTIDKLLNHSGSRLQWTDNLSANLKVIPPHRDFVDWTVTEEIDDFTGEANISASRWSNERGDSGYQSFGIRCNDNTLMLTFNAKTVIAHPSRDDIKFFVKVDNNAPIKMISRMYRNSYKSGYVEISPNHLVVTQLLAGKTAKIRIDAGDELVDWTMDLTDGDGPNRPGFKTVSSKVLDGCK